MPCNVEDVNITEPDGPVPAGIPGLGTPFAPKLPQFTLPGGFPEDLSEIFNALQMILPPGIVKPSLSHNFSKDVFDGIMSLMDKFFPFLMLYKFFLPILNIIICIIEVLCALMNPFKLIRALKRLFRQCIPEFLSLFPIFALIVMLLSMLFLLLALIEYIISQIEKLIKIILRNINALIKASSYADESSILAITEKLGMLLCSFQNIFVLLSVFAVLIEVIKDMLKVLFSIPPCDDSDPNDTDNCCTTEVCPAFIRNNEEILRTTGSLQYFSAVESGAGLLPFPLDTFTVNIRQQSHQFFDSLSPQDLEIINISDAYDITTSPKQVFFPTDVTYSSGTPINQAAYTVDLRLYYNPVTFGRVDPNYALQYGEPRFVRFKDCIVLYAPTRNLKGFDNSISNLQTGVAILAGGHGTEDDGSALLGFDSDGITPNSSPATLENFIFTQARVGANPQLLPTDGYTFDNVEYTFKINHEVLLGKSLITLGCIPTVAFDRTFVNSIFGGNVGVNYTLLNNLVTGSSGNGFPDIGAAQQCLQAALDALRLDMSQSGVAAFQATTTACLDKLRSDTRAGIGSLIGIGYDPYKSSFTVNPDVQFTSRAIKVQVQLNEGNGLSITDNLPASVATDIELKLHADVTFGSIDGFKYDGSKYFEANILSDIAGNGTVKVSFDNKYIGKATIPTDIAASPTVLITELPYSFIFTPAAQGDGVPRRDVEDLDVDSEV